MKKTDKEKKSGDGVWFERSKHWCQYPVATGASARSRGASAAARRKAKRAYAKLVRYDNAVGGGFKGWLKAQAL